jgi:hypothetical protein
MKQLSALILMVYSGLVRLYPQAFYQEYGAELLAVYLALNESQQRGRRGLLFFAGRELGDLPGSILHRHWTERSKHMRLPSSPHPCCRKSWQAVVLFLLPFSVATCFPSIYPVGQHHGTGSSAWLSFGNSGSQCGSRGAGIWKSASLVAATWDLVGF